MLTPPILIQPAADLRQAFAQWATSHTPKVRTVSPVVFAVPAHLFTAAPEHLLLGALVDGHPYVPVPPEDEAETVQAAVVSPERECSSKCVGHLPLLPPDVYPADAVPLDLVHTDEPEPPHPPPADEDQAQGQDAGAPAFACDQCPRTFTTDRGLAMHRRAHTKADS